MCAKFSLGPWPRSLPEQRWTFCRPRKSRSPAAKPPWIRSCNPRPYPWACSCRDAPSITGELNIAEVGFKSSVWVKKFVILCQPYLIIYDSNTDNTERDIIALARAEIAYDEALDPTLTVRRRCLVCPASLELRLNPSLCSAQAGRCRRVLSLEILHLHAQDIALNLPPAGKRRS